MKRIPTSILGAAIAILGAAPIALTAEVAQGEPVRSPYTPVGLVSAAYNDRLDGISSFGALESDIAEGNIGPKDLIKVGIAQGRLSPDHLADPGFINDVDIAMRNVVGDDN